MRKLWGSVKTGLAGISSLSEEDIAFATSAADSISTFVTTLQDKDVEQPPNIIQDFFNGGGDSNTNILLDQIGKFAEAMGSVKTGLAGITELTEDDMNFAFSAADSISEFIAGLKEKEVDQDPSLLSKLLWGDESSTTSLLSQIEQFGTSMGTVKANLAGLSGSELDLEDIGYATEIATSITNFINSVRESAPVYPDDGVFTAYYSELMSQIDLFSNSVGLIKENLAGLASEDSTLNDKDLGYAEEAVTRIGEFITDLDTRIDFDKIQTSSSGLKKFFVGENETESIFSQITNFFDVRWQCKNGTFRDG